MYLFYVVSESSFHDLKMTKYNGQGNVFKLTAYNIPFKNNNIGINHLSNTYLLMVYHRSYGVFSQMFERGKRTSPMQ